MASRLYRTSELSSQSTECGTGPGLESALAKQWLVGPNILDANPALFRE